MITKIYSICYLGTIKHYIYCVNLLHEIKSHFHLHSHSYWHSQPSHLDFQAHSWVGTRHWSAVQICSDHVACVSRVTRNSYILEFYIHSLLFVCLKRICFLTIWYLLFHVLQYILVILIYICYRCHIIFVCIEWQWIAVTVMYIRTSWWMQFIVLDLNSC